MSTILWTLVYKSKVDTVPLKTLEKRIIDNFN